MSVNKINQPAEGDSLLYKRIFWGLFGFIAITLMVLSLSTAINGDEKYHSYLTNHILDFYTSFGKDTTLFIGKKEAQALVKEYGAEKAEQMGVDLEDMPMGQLKDYGGFFEFFSALAARIFGYEDDSQEGFHTIRHFLVAIFGAITFLFTGLATKEIFNWRAAALALFLLFISPRFTGHSMMNAKDIPFAMGYIIALFFMLKFLKELPVPSWKTALGLAAGIAISINVRVGGILLIGYLLMFVIIFWVYHLLKKNPGYKLDAAKKLFLKVFAVCVLGYFLGLIFWPYGLVDPLNHPLEILSRAAKYPAKINQLFEGIQIRSHKLPGYYLPKFLFISNPIVVFAGGACLIVLLYWMRKYFRRDLALVVFFLFAFPVAYIIYNKSTVYGGARHVLFVYPPLVILAALGWEGLLQILKPKIAKASVAGLIALMSIIPLTWVFAEHPMQYVYFNEFVGGTKKAYQDYVTDYWQLSVKEASEWFKENIKPDKKIIVATNCPYPAQIYLAGMDSMEVKYVRYYLRCDFDWDYGIFYVDYVEPFQLKHSLYPPDKTIYTVKNGGAPMCVVIKREDKSDYFAFQALDSKRYDEAISLFNQAAKVYPNNEAVFMGLGAAYLFKREPEKAMVPLNRSLQLQPEQGLTNYYIALTNAQLGNEERAILYIKRALEINPKIKPAYLLMAAIYEQRGETATAEHWRKLAEKVKMPTKK